MDAKYPGLYDLLMDPYGSLYLNEGMFQNALAFLKDQIEDRGDIFLPTIFDGNDLKNEMARLALGRLMPRCDISTYDRFINGLEDTGLLTGMNEKEGWDVHYLNDKMMEMLWKDCIETDKRIKTDPKFRWQEENRVFTGSMSDAMTQFSKAVVMYLAMQSEPVERPAENPLGKLKEKFGKGRSKTVITPETEKKILFGQRKNPAKNKLIGGHSPDINNSNPNYAVEVLKTNGDGTQQVKFVTQFEDGNLSNIKTSTLFPNDWSNDKIIESIKQVGDSAPIGVRASDGAMLYRSKIEGVQIEVIKIGDNVTSGYPTGGGITGLLSGFNSLK